jgi:hypothetical protein
VAGARDSRVVPAAALAVFLLSLGVSAFSLPGARFVWDDTYLIQNNPSIRDLGQAGSYFTATWASGTQEGFGQAKNVSFYRPVATLSYAVDHALFGASPVAFRLVNNLLGAVAAVLVLLLLLALALPTSAAVAGALLFAVHPVHTEVLAVSAYRTEALSALFFLAALLAHVRFRPGSLVGSLCVAGLSGLAFFSKESAVPLVAALVLVDVALRREQVRSLWWQRWVPVAVVLCGYLAARAGLVQAAPGSPFSGFGAGAVFLTMVRTMALYARLLVAPWPLNAYYDPSIWPPVEDVLDPLVLVGLVVVLAYLAGMVVAWRRARTAAVLMGVAALALTPYLHLVPFRAIAGERFLYLSSAFLAGLAGLAFQQVLAVRPRAALVAGVLVLLSLSGLSAVRYRDWTDNRTIMEAKVRDFPESFDGHYVLGSYLLDVEHRPVAALPHLEEAARIWPGFAPAERELQRARREAAAAPRPRP